MEQNEAGATEDEDARGLQLIPGSRCLGLRSVLTLLGMVVSLAFWKDCWGERDVLFFSFSSLSLSSPLSLPLVRDGSLNFERRVIISVCSTGLSFTLLSV